MTEYISRYISPIGEMTLASDGTGLTGLWFQGQKYYGSTLDSASACVRTDPHTDPVLMQTVRWLDEYFAGRIPLQRPPLAPKGSPFRQKVWRLLLRIPYGETVTYGALASRLAAEEGRPSLSAQAVGGAVGHNPVSILIPCHRVVGKNGSLTGYAGGLEKKKFLLELEQRRGKERK